MTTQQQDSLNVVAFSAMSRKQLVSCVAAFIIRKYNLSSTYGYKTIIIQFAKNTLRGVPGITKLSKEVFNEVKRQIDVRKERYYRRPRQLESPSIDYSQGVLSKQEKNRFLNQRAHSILFGETHHKCYTRRSDMVFGHVFYFARIGSVVVIGGATPKRTSHQDKLCLIFLDQQSGMVDLYLRKARGNGHLRYMVSNPIYDHLQPVAIDIFLKGDSVRRAITEGRTINVDLPNQRITIDGKTFCLKDGPYYKGRVRKEDLRKAIKDN